MAYGIEKRVSKRGKEFGTGAIEGVAAPEAANNAAANANFVPTLTLGIPGGATTAVLLGAFMINGIQPGPLLFEEQPTLVWGLLASFFIGNVILLVLNLPLAPVFAQILRVPYGYMYPLILLTSLVGAYSISNGMYSVWVVLIFGIIGYFMKRLDLPMAPLVLGLVLGPLFEKALVQTSAIGDGNVFIVFTRPLALVVMAIAILQLAAPSIMARLLRRRATTRTRRSDIRRHDIGGLPPWMNQNCSSSPDGGVLTVTFNRPRQRNAMTWGMYEGLYEACEQADADDEIRVLVLKAAGDKAFVAGTDISQFSDFSEGARRRRVRGEDRPHRQPARGRRRPDRRGDPRLLRRWRAGHRLGLRPADRRPRRPASASRSPARWATACR